jgi:hypothetical protein
MYATVVTVDVVDGRKHKNRVPLEGKNLEIVLKRILFGDYSESIEQK